MGKPYTQINIDDPTLEKFRKLKTEKSYSKEIDNYLTIKEKVLKGQKVTSEDLNILNDKRFKE